MEGGFYLSRKSINMINRNFCVHAGLWLTALSGVCTASTQPVDIKLDRFEQWPGYTRAAAIEAIGQDANGFLWLTTPRGSVRFDGNISNYSCKSTCYNRHSSVKPKSGVH